MEKNSAKISLGTAICMFIIIVLIMALAIVYYLGFIKNNVNTIIKVDSNVEKVAIEEKELYEFSDFELIYKSLINTEYNNLKSFVTSENKIKDINVSVITLYTEDYLNATGIKLTEKADENTIMGSCVFSIEFENIEGLALAGSKGNIHAIVGNCLTDEKDFIFNKTTGKIELCTSLYIVENETVSNNAENVEVDVVKSKSYGEPLPLEGVAVLKEGYLYYSYNNSEEPEKIEGVSNIKSLNIFNIGTGINRVPFVVTEDGVVYRLNSAKKLVVYEELSNYKVDKIVSHEGEMYDVFTLLLSNGTTKVVEVKE